MSPILPIGIEHRSATKTTTATNGDATAGQDIRKAAAEFEALLIQQLLRSARESGSMSGPGDGGDSFDSIMDYSEQQIARMLSGSGGLGLSELIESGLKQPSSADDHSSTTAPGSRSSD